MKNATRSLTLALTFGIAQSAAAADVRPVANQLAQLFDSILEMDHDESPYLAVQTEPEKMQLLLQTNGACLADRDFQLSSTQSFGEEIFGVVYDLSYIGLIDANDGYYSFMESLDEKLKRFEAEARTSTITICNEETPDDSLVTAFRIDGRLVMAYVTGATSDSSHYSCIDSNGGDATIKQTWRSVQWHDHAHSAHSRTQSLGREEAPYSTELRYHVYDLLDYARSEDSSWRLKIEPAYEGRTKFRAVLLFDNDSHEQSRTEYVCRPG